MPAPGAQAKGSSRTPILLSILVLGVAFTAAMFLWPSRSALSDDGYEIAIALYRVCNQRSVPGIESIEKQISDLRENSGVNDDSLVHLEEIVATAKSGDWSSAMRASRALLDDQVQQR